MLVSDKQLLYDQSRIERGACAPPKIRKSYAMQR